MDWTLAIEKNREALKRILAMLVAMVEISGDRPISLPRHLHRLVLRLLRPAEAATRRLIVVAARGLVVELAPPRTPKPKLEPKPAMVQNGLGQLVPAPPRWPTPVRARGPIRPRALSLPLFDPLKRFGVRKYVKRRDLPRITFDFDRPRQPDPVPLTPDDPLDAGRLHRRLEAIGRVLDDLPRQAKRLARWQARRDAGNLEHLTPGLARPSEPPGADRAAGARKKRQRLFPMRPGRPPGWRRKPDHPVYEVLDNLHGLAFRALERPDTS